MWSFFIVDRINVKHSYRIVSFVIILVQCYNNGGLKMTLTLYWYTNCSTCRKAKKWLDDHDQSYETVHLVEQTPTKQDMLNLMELSDLEPRRFFNTHGKKYRELNMKDKIDQLSVDEMAEYLASDGMLIKRPIVTNGKEVTVGFKEAEFANIWK